MKKLSENRFAVFHVFIFIRHVRKKYTCINLFCRRSARSCVQYSLCINGGVTIYNIIPTYVHTRNPPLTENRLLNISILPRRRYT